MAVAAILDFLNPEILLGHRSRVPTRIIVPFFSKLVSRLWRYSNLSISRWQPPPSWIFEIAKFYLLTGSIGCEDFQIFLVFKMAAVLGFLWAYLDHPHRVLGVSITLQNLVMIDAVVLIIWTFQYLACLAGKCLFTPPKIGFCGNLIP